ncbi:MAG: glutathione S-transferase N-terminal domain-containing protein [Paracoccaceae bacterium]|nr:glutathione S-transferase N-terminal domain-containing protein [Paracoccaceae bacterium]
MLTLYYAPDTCALAPHIVLEEIGADYAARRIDFSTREQTGADYRNINPKARVPSLVTDQGILTEVPALLVYLAQTYPEARLAPDDPFALARVQEFNAYLCATVHVAHAHRMRGHRWADDEAAHEAMKKKVPQSVTDAFTLIEDGMLRGPWVMGEAYTVCDPYLFTLAQWLEADSADLARLPRVLAHRERVAARPATQRAIAQELEGLPA